MRLCVITCMHCRTSSSGATVITGALMICQTGVSADDRPSRITLRA
jgi:hypothetical protein